jgi:PAS domain S-box-containing protein
MFNDGHMAECLKTASMKMILAAALMLAVILTAGLLEAEAQGDLPVLTQAAQIRRLTAEEAQRGYPVDLRGVITYNSNMVGWWVTFFQDSTAGIFIFKSAVPENVRPGDLVEVRGRTGPGDFAPVVESARVRVVGKAPLPPAHRFPLDDLLTGREDSQWVEVMGVVRSAVIEPPFLILGIAAGSHKFRAWIREFKRDASYASLIDAEVAIRGACGALFNDKRQLVGIQLWVPSLEQVRIEHAAPSDPYALPILPTSSVMQFTPERVVGHRLRVQGVVTLDRPGQFISVQDASSGVVVLSRQSTPVQPGDRVDAVGFPAPGRYTPVLEDGEFRKIGHGTLPKPVDLTHATTLSGTQDAELVKIQGRLIDQSMQGEDVVLTMQTGSFTFTARLEKAHADDKVRRIPVGSLLETTGLWSTETDEYRTTSQQPVDNPVVPMAFRILLRSAGDISVLEKPSWWTAGRIAWLLIMLAGIVFWISFWVVVLRRRVEERTETIRATLESTVDGILVVNSAGKILAYNRKLAEMWRIPESVLGSRDDNVVLSFVLSQLKDPDAFLTRVRQTYADHDAQTDDVIEFKDGRVFERHSEPQRVKGRNVGRVWGFRDITERKRAEDGLRESEQFNREVIANAQEGVTVYDRDFRYQVWNRFMEELTGVPASEALGKRAFDLFPHLREQKVDLLIRRALAGEVVHTPDAPFCVATTGKSGWVSSVYSPHFGASGQIHGVIGTIRDITERKRAEEAIRASEQRYRLLFERNLAGVCRTTLDGRFLDCNDAYARILGYQSRDEMLARPVLSVFFDPAEREAYWAKLRERGTLSNYELRLRRKDESEVWVLANDTLLDEEVDGQSVKETTLIDITERRRAEEALREANRALTAISAVNEAVLHKTEELLLLQEVCRCIVQHAGYRMAWVGFLNDDEPKRIYPVAEAGFEQGYLHSIDVRCDDSERGCGPAGTAARTRKPAIVRNTATDAGFAPWRAEATARGYASVIGLPLLTGENLLGVLTIYSAQPGAFDQQEVHFLSELAGDLAFGIQALRTRAEQARAEEALIEERHLLHTLMDNLPDAIYFKDRESRFTRINKALAKAFGLKDPTQAAGKIDFDFFTREHAQQAFADEQEIIRTGQPSLAKLEKETWPDGRETWASTTKMPLRDAQGRIVGTFGISHDVTERKRAEEALRESEEHFRRFIENIPLGVCRTTPDGRVLMANAALVRMLGYDSWQELASRNLEGEALEAGYRRSAFREQIEREGEVGGLEAAWKRRDGRVIFVRESARAFRADDGRVLYYDCIVEDVTERRQLGEQLRHAQKMEAVGCLAGGVAHDFNNLLTIVIGYSDLLLKKLTASDGMRSPVEEIRKAAERAASLTRQLLAFSRKQMLQPQILDLNSLLTNVDEMLRRMIGEDIELSTHLPSGLGRVKADPGQIEQVIMNLAVNARDAMPQGGQLTLEAANVELGPSYARSHESVLPGHYVMIAMSDTGIGMDAETQAHIFEPFFTTKEQGKGTGLGLATVYGIVKQSGGSIRVYSEPGRGTTFKVYLPQIDQSVQVIAPTNAPADALSRGSETILLAEDEEALRSLVRGVLESTGYQVLETKGANDALEVGERHRKHIHLLLTDVVMPQMSGAELVKHLVRLHPETKVLYMSGYADHAVVHHGVLDPSTAFLQKPFTPDALALKVREVLDSLGAQRT